ncbi:MAG: DnaJ domain-containing protein [Candidatus Altiarchaeales archaeon]|nr:DnaJ domain-containing protein [Candidatus Altiarchaeales archaeon]
MDALSILGLRPGDSLEDAKARHRTLCKRYHPDKNPGNDQTAGFIAMQEAYEAILKDPSLLKKPVDVDNLPSYLDTPVEIRLEDIYFARKKTVKIERNAPCTSCLGTGSELGPEGLCATCKGTGRIESNVLDLMGRSSVCPICSGLGYTGKPCQSCIGTKRTNEVVECTFLVNLRSYYKRTVVLKGKGNIQTDGSCGDLILSLKIAKHPRFHIEGNNFCTNVPVLPVQRILGDRSRISVFGRILTYHILPNTTETYIIDEIRPSLQRGIKLSFVEIAPLLTDETKKMYKKILEIEKPRIKDAVRARSKNHT